MSEGQVLCSAEVAFPSCAVGREAVASPSQNCVHHRLDGSVSVPSLRCCGHRAETFCTAVSFYEQQRRPSINSSIMHLSMNLPTYLGNRPTPRLFTHFSVPTVLFLAFKLKLRHNSHTRYASHEFTATLTVTLIQPMALLPKSGLGLLLWGFLITQLDTHTDTR
jgi:hypothetical protein